METDSMDVVSSSEEEGIEIEESIDIENVENNDDAPPKPPPEPVKNKKGYLIFSQDEEINKINKNYLKNNIKKNKIKKKKEEKLNENIKNNYDKNSKKIREKDFNFTEQIIDLEEDLEQEKRVTKKRKSIIDKQIQKDITSYFPSTKRRKENEYITSKTREYLIDESDALDDDLNILRDNSINSIFNAVQERMNEIYDNDIRSIEYAANLVNSTTRINLLLLNRGYFKKLTNLCNNNIEKLLNTLMLHVSINYISKLSVYEKDKILEIVDVYKKIICTIMNFFMCLVEGSLYVTRFNNIDNLWEVSLSNLNNFDSDATRWMIPKIGPKGASKAIKFIDFYKTNIHTNKVSYICYHPTNDIKYYTPNELNVYAGIPYNVDFCSGKECFEFSRLRMFLNHIYYIFCKGDPLKYYYLITYIADMFKHPERKPECGLLLCGLNSVGKNLIFSLIQELLGSNNTVTIQSEHDLIGDFNSNMLDKQLIIIDELTIPKYNLDARIKINNKIKMEIADELGRKRLMYKDPKTTKKWERFVFFTNNQDSSYPLSDLEGGTKDRRLTFFTDIGTNIKIYLKNCWSNMTEDMYFSNLAKSFDKKTEYGKNGLRTLSNFFHYWPLTVKKMKNFLDKNGMMYKKHGYNKIDKLLIDLSLEGEYPSQLYQSGNLDRDSIQKYFTNKCTTSVYIEDIQHRMGVYTGKNFLNDDKDDLSVRFPDIEDLREGLIKSFDGYRFLLEDDIKPTYKELSPVVLFPEIDIVKGLNINEMFLTEEGTNKLYSDYVVDKKEVFEVIVSFKRKSNYFKKEKTERILNPINDPNQEIYGYDIEAVKKIDLTEFDSCLNDIHSKNLKILNSQEPLCKESLHVLPFLETLTILQIIGEFFKEKNIKEKKFNEKYNEDAISIFQDCWDIYFFVEPFLNSLTENFYIEEKDLKFEINLILIIDDITKYFQEKIQRNKDALYLLKNVLLKDERVIELSKERDLSELFKEQVKDYKDKKTDNDYKMLIKKNPKYVRLIENICQIGWDTNIYKKNIDGYNKKIKLLKEITSFEKNLRSFAFCLIPFIKNFKIQKLVTSEKVLLENLELNSLIKQKYNEGYLSEFDSKKLKQEKYKKKVCELFVLN